MDVSPLACIPVPLDVYQDPACDASRVPFAAMTQCQCHGVRCAHCASDPASPPRKPPIGTCVPGYVSCASSEAAVESCRVPSSSPCQPTSTIACPDAVLLEHTVSRDRQGLQRRARSKSWAAYICTTRPHLPWPGYEVIELMKRFGMGDCNPATQDPTRYSKTA